MLRVLLVLLLCAATTGSATQDRSTDPAARRLRLTLEPGTAVPPALHADRDVTLRWQARSEDRIVVRGTFDGQDGDSLRIDPEGPLDVFAVSWASISRLERHAGVRRHTGGFALAFGVPGALVGAIGGAAFCSGDYYCEAGPTANALKWGAILGAGSAALGALVGSAVVTDRWERIEAPLVVDPTVIHGRIGAAISLRF